ncbi:MAG: hypothetical protein Q9193_002169 [Seirophora villosa]
MAPKSFDSLPNEVSSQVFSCLDKGSLKNVRRTSKVFSALATRHLFDTIFVGPSSLTLDVFQNIVNHPVLSASIKVLVYDAVKFHEIINFEGYCELFKLWCRHARRGDVAIEKREDLTIREIERCLVLVYGDLIHSDPAGSTAEAINENEAALAAQAMAAGFERWKGERSQQLHYATTNEMRSRLTFAIRQLPSLTSVRMQTFWEGTVYQWRQGEKHSPLLPGHESSGPLARSWSSWHLPPPYPELGADLASAVKDIISTMALSCQCAPTRPIGNLVRLELDVHTSAFEREADWVNVHFEDALASLEHLKLRLYTEFGWPLTSTKYQALDLWTSYLTKARTLQYLDINIDRLSSKRDHLSKNYCPVQFRVPHHVFPRLERFRLRGVRFNVEQMITFLTAQPALTWLEFDTFCLMSEDESITGDRRRDLVTFWTFIDGIIRLRPLKSFKLQAPVLDGMTNLLISKKRWNAARYDRLIQGFAEGRGLDQAHGGYLYMDGKDREVRKIL